MSPAEKKHLQSRSGLFFLSSVASYLVILALPLSGTNAIPDLLTLPVLGVGLLSWFLGCGKYAKSKGYPMHYGFLGFMTFIGLLWLVLLRDKTKGAAPMQGVFVPPLPATPREPTARASKYNW